MVTVRADREGKRDNAIGEQTEEAATRRNALQVVYVSPDIDRKYRREIDALLRDERVCSKSVETEIGSVMVVLDGVINRENGREHLYELEYTVNLTENGSSKRLGFFSVGPIDIDTWPYLKEFYGRNGISEGDRLVELFNFYPFGNLYGDNRPHREESEYRHKHVGEAILERIIEDYRSEGVAAIVGVNRDVPEMQSLLRKVGFENVRQPIYDKLHTTIKGYTDYFVMRLK
jgi:hypothetical protein